MGFPGVCVLEATEPRINTRQLRGNKLALLVRADFTMLKKKTELTWLSRASFCQLEHMIVSSQRRTQRKRRTKWSKISKNLCVNKHRSLLIWTCGFMAPRGGALSGHHPNTPLFTHTEAKSLWSHEARVWDPDNSGQEQRGLQPQTRLRLAGWGRGWEVLGYFRLLSCLVQAPADMREQIISMCWRISWRTATWASFGLSRRHRFSTDSFGAA